MDDISPHNEDHGPGTPESPGAPISSERARPRTGSIVWGALFLAFCAWITQRTFFPDSVTPALWFTVTAIGLGALLLAVGITVAVRDSRRTKQGTGSN